MPLPNFFTNGDETISGSWSSDIIYTRGGDDYIYGYGGADTIEAGEGDDTVRFVGEERLIDGGSGVDWIVLGLFGGYSFDFRSDENQFVATANSNQVVRVIGFENLDGSKSISSIVATLSSLSGTLIGGEAADTLSGDLGNDTLLGGLGDDRLSGGSGDDLLGGGDGDNYLNGGDGSDLFIVGRVADTIIGGPGLDTASLSGAYRDYSIDPEAGDLPLKLRNVATKSTATFTSIEYFQFTDRYVSLSDLISGVDATSPIIAITSSNTKLKAGETALITFTLSEPATDFVVSDIAFTGDGTLTGFSGSGSNYSAVFTPAPTGEGLSVVSVGNFKFSDAAGNANQDGADANNRLELTYDTVIPTITITSNKTHLGLGENATVTFTLSEPSTDFTIEDITTTYGTLTGFSGSGKSYTATFVPSGVDGGLITVNPYRFSDSFGNQNNQSTQLLITPFDPSRGNVQWTRLLGTSSYDGATALTAGTDGAIYMAGYTSGSFDGQTNSGSQDAFLTKYDANGSKAWTRQLGTSRLDEATALTTGTDGAIYMAGYTIGGYDAFLTKYDANGTEAWTRLLGTGWDKRAYALTTGSDGAIYMAGSTQGSLDGQTNSGGYDAFLTKYDANGTKLWTRLLGSSSSDLAEALTTGTDGAIYMAGYTGGSLDGQTFSGGNIDAFLTKYNADGSKAWTRLLGTSSDERAYALTTGTDGAIYMAGSTQGSLDGQTSDGSPDAFLTKYNPDGSKAWTRQLRTSWQDSPVALTTGSDGAIYMAGYTGGSLDGQTNSGGYDAFLTKYDANGTKAWTRLLGTSSDDGARALTTGSDGAIYMAGYTQGSLDGQTSSGPSDAFLAKFVLPDSAIPTIALQADKTSVTAGGSVAITFTLSKPSTSFIASDVTVVNGVLSNFSGSGTTYTATFTPSLGSATASLSVGSGKFSDALGNFNEDSADADNKVTFSIAPVTITLNALSSSVNEGATAAFALTTTNVAAGGLIPYTISGLSTADIEGGLLTGSVAVDADGRATINIPILADQVTEGDETLTVTVQDKTATTVIKDTSLNPAPTYQVTANAAKVSEGSTAVFTVVTTNVASGTSLNYTLSGVSASDISSGSLSGSVQVGSNGQAQINVGLLADQRTEGEEVLTVTLQGKSASVAIVDSSQDPPPTYALAASGASADEGSSVVFTLSTTNVSTGTVIPFVLSGVATSDLSGSLTGSFTIGANGKASAAIGILADKTTEGAETLTMTAHGQSASVVIQDTSTHAKLSSTLKVAAGEVVQIGRHTPLFRGYDPDWTKMTAGSLEQFNVDGRGNGDNVIRAINVMTILDDPADGRQIDPINLGFCIEQIEEGTLTLGDKVMRDILSGFVYGKDFRDLALKRMDTDGDGVNDISYTKAAVQTMYRNVLGRSWADIVNDGGLNYLVSEIEGNRLTIVEVAERVCLGAEAINSAVAIVGEQDLSFIAFGDGFGS